MPKSAVDCHFFLSGACRNGDACAFRHSDAARNSDHPCPEFAQSAHCSAADCGLRHAEPAKRTARPPSEVPCRNEENGAVCTRPDCIFKHARPRAPLNPAAKAFVPRSMEWSAESKPAQVFANKEWTPESAKPQKLFANKEWTPDSAKPQKLFANKEWTPSSAKPKKPFGNMEWTPESAAKQPTFGNMEWTPDAADNTLPAEPINPKPLGNIQWTPGASAKPQSFGSAFQTTNRSAFASTASQLAAAKPTTFANKEWAPSSTHIPTLYDILGIAEPDPNAAAAKYSRQHHSIRNPVARSPSNSVSETKVDPVSAVNAESAPPKVPAPEIALEPAAMITKDPTPECENKPPALLSFDETIEPKRPKLAHEPDEECKQPKTKNYVGLFEEELNSLDSELCGPLDNTPSSDPISKAVLQDSDITYI
ncbi:hypothetical protein H4R23_000773 [Coemansia sp. Cherry 401B]|nr:hypothetical protein H4R23_000773 [Coemansia sp. Cherry 401B]